MTVLRAMLMMVLLVLLTAAAPADWGNLSRWVGRYPTDSDTHPPIRLFDIPPVRATVDRLLSLSDRHRLRALTTEAPIEQSGPFLIVKQCMPHDCGNQNAMVVIDSGARRMWVGFFSRTLLITSTRWFGTSDFRDLPADVRQEFDAQHEPR